jgi:phosphoglycerate dehydrogenase-like enzyme
MEAIHAFYPRSIVVLSRSFSRHPVLRAELVKQYETVAFNDSGITLSGYELVEFLKPHDAAIVALERIDEDVLKQLPNLRVISKYGVGLDNIDLHAAARSGIRVGWQGGVNRRSVAELMIAFAIAGLRGVTVSHQDLQAGVWRQYRGRQLSNATVGLIGFGYVGQEIAHLLKAFGATVIAYDIRELSRVAANLGVALVTLDELLRRVDVVSLHVPYTAQTAGIIGADQIALMRAGAILINTARGGLVDEAAALTALQEGKLAAFCLDVYAVEPPSNKRMFDIPGFIGTAHIGGSSEEAVLAMGRAAIAGLREACDPLSFVPEYAL